MALIVQHLGEETVASTKEHLMNLITMPENKDEFVSLQTTLDSRSDLTNETLLKCHQIQLEFLVAIKTGLGGFLSEKTSLPTTELVEVFLLESWVGCDACLHWGHAVCAIRRNLIKPGPSSSGTNELQFNCLGCGHALQMFGFVKDVFMSCAKEWDEETLMKELDFVPKIFQRSEDLKRRFAKKGVAIVLFDLLNPRGTNIDKVKDWSTAFPNWDNHLLYGNSSCKDRLGAEIHILGRYKEPRRTYSLSCTDSSLSMPHPCRILQKYTTLGESNSHPLSFLKSPSNIAYS
ncbi:putative ABC transporter G family member 32-like [Capsicum annuum]|nr:putative ABC transporter G family member 32-like [Capsicum annuum]